MRLSSNDLSKLSVNEVAKVISVCYHNAKSLLDDAKLLLSHNRPPRAVSLAILADEELAKASLLTKAWVDNEEKLWLDAKDAFRKHEPKLVDFILEYLAKEYMEKGPQRIEQLLGKAAKAKPGGGGLNETKQQGIYVCLWNDQVGVPAEVISLDFAKEVISETEKMIEAYSSFSEDSGLVVILRAMRRDAEEGRVPHGVREFRQTVLKYKKTITSSQGKNRVIK